MQISKKLLFLLCIAFISVSYGILDEEAKNEKIEFYKSFFDAEKKVIKEISANRAITYNGALIFRCKNHPLKDQLCNTMSKLEMDTVLTTDNQSYNFVDLQPIIDLADSYARLYAVVGLGVGVLIGIFLLNRYNAWQISTKN